MSRLLETLRLLLLVRLLLRLTLWSVSVDQEVPRVQQVLLVVLMVQQGLLV